MGKLRLLAAALIVLLLLLPSFQGYYQLLNYKTATPTLGEIVQEVSLPGKVSAEETVDLSFKSAGKIASISAEVNQKVKKGDILATLDRESLWQTIQQTYADLNAANSNYYKAKDKLGATREAYKTDPHSEAARTAIGQDQTAADAALFALDKTKFQVAAAEKAWAEGALYAPFDGEVVRVNGRMGQSVS